MENIKAYFEDVSAKSFHYDKDSRLFIIDGREIALQDFDQYSVSLDPVQSSDTSLSAMYITVFGLVGTPKLYHAFQTNESINRIRQDIVDTMVDAFETLIGDKLPKTLRKPDSHMGFNIGLYRPGHPSVNVLGTCACMGVNTAPHTFSEEMAEGYMEFVGHNIDIPTQMTSLHAGLGRLAVLCD